MNQSEFKIKVDWKGLIIKTTILLILCNLIYALLIPHLSIGKLTLYNAIFPGRLRLPYGDDPSQSYNLTLNNLDAMFASHIIAKPGKPTAEFRVVLIGDSATWGYLLSNDHTLAGYLNQLQLFSSDGRKLIFYNLGYPTMSLTKDLMILTRSLTYQPDLIIWLVTLESFPKDKQTSSPLIQENLDELFLLIKNNHLENYLSIPSPQPKNLWKQTIIAQRKQLADLYRYQLYGFDWAATHIDQFIPENLPPRQEDLTEDLTFHGFQPSHLPIASLSFPILEAGENLAKPVPVIFVNEPIFISHGENSATRYNFYYPRWAYDDYRKWFSDTCKSQNWICWDLWDLIPSTEFTNTAIHMTPSGTQQSANWIGEQLANWLKTRP